jgi:DNA polymerase-1
MPKVQSGSKKLDKREKEEKKDKKIVKKKLILLDVHAIIHRAYHALPDFVSSKGEPTGALYGLCTMLIKIVTDLKPNFIAACYDLPGKTYRHEAYDAYKAGRVKTDDALVSQLIRSRDIFKTFNIPMYEMAGFEADDMLGTIVEKMKDQENIDIIIASGDMDTLQLVRDDRVRVYTLKKGIKDTIIYNEKAVIERFGFPPFLLPDYKGLRGDPSDNIIGIKGIGEKTGSILIQQFGAIEDIYKKLKKDEKSFGEAGLSPRIIELLKAGEEEAKFSKMLATIRRDAPIDFSLPEKDWKESLTIEPIIKLFSELEFRSLGPRIKEAFSLQPTLMQGVMSRTMNGSSNKISNGGADSVGDDLLNGGDNFSDGIQNNLSTPTIEEEIKNQNISEMDLKRVSIALWVLNSNLTNPTLDDIFNFTLTRDFKEAEKIIFAQLKKANLLKVFDEIELPLMPVVDRMEKRGVKIDKEYLKKLSKKYHAELEKLQAKIWKEAGEEFNINSPKQLGVVLFEKMALTAKNLKKTEGGAKSTRESELEKLREGNPIIQYILEYRELQKLLSTYIDTIPTTLDDNDRLHANFIQAGSTTGRMSSNNPNLQNIPIKTELGRNIRNGFIAEKGFTLLAFDYSQIELRIAAFLSGDKTLIEIFRKGEDVHTSVASRVFNVPLEKVDKEMRRKAKVINFGIIYGMGINALRANLGTNPGTSPDAGLPVERKDAQKFYNDYFENFKTLGNYLNKIKAETARMGYTETFYGRRRTFEGINSKLAFIRAAAERMAINAPIQGTEADIVKLAMIKIEEYIQKEKLANDVYPLLQVHDELVYEVKENLVPKIEKHIKKIMETVIDPKDIDGIVCVAEAKVGKNWGEMEAL